MRRFALRLLNYFFNGLLLVVPIALTVYLLYSGVMAIDHLMPMEYHYPGLGFLSIIAVLTLLGMLGRSFIVRPLLVRLERWVLKAPLVKIIYTSIRDLMEAFVGDKRKFNQPVLADMSGTGVYRIGFVTQESMAQWGEKDLASVYFPQSYAFAGDLFLIEKSRLKPLKMNASDAMKMVISGGIANAEEG